MLLVWPLKEKGQTFRLAFLQSSGLIIFESFQFFTGNRV
jgi:hypothetical protein